MLRFRSRRRLTEETSIMSSGLSMIVEPLLDDISCSMTAPHNIIVAAVSSNIDRHAGERFIEGELVIKNNLFCSGVAGGRMDEDDPDDPHKIIINHRSRIVDNITNLYRIAGK